MPTDDLPPDRLLLPEAAARRLLLAHAIDQIDVEGRLVGATERERIEQDALAATGDPARGERVDARAWLLDRADRLLALLAHRQPRLAALAQAPGWLPWAAWGLPLLALVLGGVIDRIDNPKQVNLLSPPLLLFVLWNLGVYIAILVFALRSQRPASTPSASWLSHLLDRRTGGLRGDVAKAFGVAWWRAAGPLEGQRWRRILHTGAAAWAVGVALSIVLGGLVREYRVGWESTLLDLPQVHAVLRMLFAPVVALLPIEPFSQAELARLHFGSGVEVGRLEARRWVGLYVALLVVLVVLPRTLLALWAAFRQHRLARAVAIDLREPVFAAMLGRISPARVRLGLLALSSGDAAMARLLLRQAGAHAAPRAGVERWTVLDTARGDALVCEPWPRGRGESSGDQAQGWRERLVRRRPGQAEVPATAVPDILLVVGDGALPETVVPELRNGGCPVLVLGSTASAGATARALRASGLPVTTLQMAQLQTWHDDRLLRDAMAQMLPSHMAAGWSRLAALWEEHARTRLARSMQSLADELLACARDTQALDVSPMGVRQLVVRGERDASEAARVVAVAALAARVHERQLATDRHLVALHGVDAPAHAEGHALPGAVRVHHAVDEPQAGLAGVASGAAMGAAVDLMTGGLTLGAASALGALVGGGAALIAAAWKNRAGQPGASLVMLDERVLLGLVDLALLRYLRVAHAGRPGAGNESGWQEAVQAASQPQAAQWRELLAQARGTNDGASTGPRLADALQQAALRMLARMPGQP